MCLAVITEAVLIGLVAAIVGTIISTLFMLRSKRFSWKTYDFWPRIALSYFVTGALLHLMFEATGANRWYCKHGNSCKKA